MEQILNVSSLAVNAAPYVAPVERYFPRDNDFTDHAQRTLTPACTKLYDTVVRLCDRKTGLCPFDALQIANCAGLGYSTARAHLKTLEARGFIARIKHPIYRGTDAYGNECYRGGQVHYQVLGKESWQLVPRAPRKPRGKDRPNVEAEALAARSLAEIKQVAAERKRVRAENQRTKQDCFFKTKSQDKQQARPEAKVEAPAAVAVLPSIHPEHTKPSECEHFETSVLHPKMPSSRGIATPEQQQKPFLETNHELLAQVLAVGVKPEAKARELLANHAPEVVQAQLEMLPDRAPKNPAAVLVKAIRENWDAPPAYLKRQEANAAVLRAKKAQAEQVAERAKESQQKAAERDSRTSKDAENARLDAAWEAMPQSERESIERQIDVRLGDVLPFLRQSPPARQAMRRTLQREPAST